MLGFAACDARAQQQAIGSTATAQNQVTRELSGAAGPLTVGDSVYRNEVVRTGTNSLAKLVFLNSTNLAVGPTSRVLLDRFVYEGDPNSEKVAVGLAKGLFRFTTGTLDKKAYTITTPTAAIGVRGTVLDIDVRSGRLPGDARRRTGAGLPAAQRRSASSNRRAIAERPSAARPRRAPGVAIAPSSTIPARPRRPGRPAGGPRPA